MWTHEESRGFIGLVCMFGTSACCSILPPKRPISLQVDQIAVSDLAEEFSVSKFGVCDMNSSPTSEALRDLKRGSFQNNRSIEPFSQQEVESSPDNLRLNPNFPSLVQFSLSGQPCIGFTSKDANQIFVAATS